MAKTEPTKTSSFNDDLKSVKISTPVHTKVKTHLASNPQIEMNMTQYTDAALLEKLARDKKGKK